MDRNLNVIVENKIRYTAKVNNNATLSFFATDFVDVIDQYKNMLKELEWQLDDEWEEARCPKCENWQREGHEADCQLGILLSD